MRHERLIYLIPVSILVCTSLFFGCASVEEGAGTGEETGPVLTDDEKEQENYNRIEESFKKGETEKALEIYEETSGEDKDAEDLLLYGMLLFSNGEVEKAREVMQKASDSEPENTEILFNLSILEGVSGDQKKREELLEKIVDIAPDHVEARQRWAKCIWKERKKPRRKPLLKRLWTRIRNMCRPGWDTPMC